MVYICIGLFIIKNEAKLHGVQYGELKKKKKKKKVNIETRKDNKSKPQAGEGEKAWFRANKFLMNCKLCLQKHKNFFLSKNSISNKMESNPNC